MATLANRPNTALLVVDVQNGVVAQAHDRDEVVSNIVRVVERARAHEVPVIWVRHNDNGLKLESDDWQIVEELSPGANESLVEKNYGDAFEDTNLGSLLEELAVGHLVVTGAQTDMCIRSTLHGAITRGYDALLVSDAHTTEDLTEWGAPSPKEVIAHTNLYWSGHRAPGRQGGTVTTAELDFERGFTSD